VSKTRAQDNWVKLQVPQVQGIAGTNWAAPMGFSSGSAPAAGSIVLVLFVGGDINTPVYALTSQALR